jgi:hypothetical protein
MTVAATGSNLVSNEQDPLKYLASAYTTAGVACLAEEFGGTPKAGTGTPNLSAAPAAGKYWVYNLFPTTVPHIIIKIAAGAKYLPAGTGATEQTITTVKYITVSTFKYSGGTKDGQDVAMFEANNIYTLGDIQFDYEDLSDNPEDKAVDALVTVQMLPWVENTIIWSNN